MRTTFITRPFFTRLPLIAGLWLATAGVTGWRANAEDTACLADLNGDQVVDGADFGALLVAWGPCPGCPEDLNGDGVVDGADVGLLLVEWGMCP